MKMIHITDTISISAIALGATGMGVDESERTRFAIMDSYVARGGNCFDTARIYAGGACDVALGKWLRQSGMRDQVVVCSKGCHPRSDSMHVSRLSPQEILGDLEASLQAMGLEWVDLYLLHRDDPRLPVEGIVRALDQAVRSGKTRAAGVSNWTAGRIAQANQFAAENDLHPLRLCQMHYSLAMTTAPQTLDVTHVPMNDIEYRWYRETQLPIMAYGTQARGFFARHAAELPQKPGPMQYYGHLPANLRRAQRAIQLAERLDVSLAALLTAYVRDSGLSTAALVGVSSLTQLDEVWDATRFFLTPEQIRFLQEDS